MKRYWTDSRVGKWLGGCLFGVLVVAIAGAAVAQSRRAAESRAVIPGAVLLVEWYDSLLEQSPHALDSTGWSDAEVVLMVSQALRATMDPRSSGTWRPGFEAHLQLKGLKDWEIRAAVLRAYAKISLEVADAVFVELGKPSP